MMAKKTTKEKSGIEKLLKNLEEKEELKGGGKTSGPFGSEIEYKYKARTLKLKKGGKKHFGSTTSSCFQPLK